MFRRAVICIIILSTLAANCSRFFVLAGLQLNRKYIAENLCVNRSRPWMHCDGKCYFMKKIRQAEENEKKESAKDNSRRLEVSFCQEPFELCFAAPVYPGDKVKLFSFYTYQYSSSFIDTIFKPPQRTV